MRRRKRPFCEKNIAYKKIAHAKKIFWLDSNLRPSGLIALIAQICAQLRYLALKKITILRLI